MPLGNRLGLCRGCLMESASWRGGLGPACARDLERDNLTLRARLSEVGSTRIARPEVDRPIVGYRCRGYGCTRLHTKDELVEGVGTPVYEGDDLTMFARPEDER